MILPKSRSPRGLSAPHHRDQRDLAGRFGLHHPTLYKPVSGCPRYIHIARPAQQPSQPGANQVTVGLGKAQHRPPAEASLLSATSLAHFSPPVPSEQFPCPTKKRLESHACCRVQQPPHVTEQGQAAAAGSGRARVKPWQGLTPMPGPVAHAALRASPLLAAQPVRKLNRVSEINLFPLPKQPGNASLHQRQPQRPEAVVRWYMSFPGGFWLEEGEKG